MKMDELDHILVSEKDVEPSATFIRNVMAQVEAEDSIHRSLPFPWVPFSAFILVVALLSFWYFPADSFVLGIKHTIQAVGSWISISEDPGSRHTVQYLLLSLTGSLVLIWLSLRLADANR